MEKTYYVCHFEIDNSFALLHSAMGQDAMKNLDEQNQTVKGYYDELGWCEGKIWKTTTSLKQAQKEMAFYIKHGEQYSTSEDEICKTTPLKTKTPFKRKHNDADEDEATKYKRLVTAEGLSTSKAASTNPNKPICANSTTKPPSHTPLGNSISLSRTEQLNSSTRKDLTTALASPVLSENGRTNTPNSTQNKFQNSNARFQSEVTPNIHASLPSSLASSSTRFSNSDNFLSLDHDSTLINDEDEISLLRNPSTQAMIRVLNKTVNDRFDRLEKLFLDRLSGSDRNDDDRKIMYGSKDLAAQSATSDTKFVTQTLQILFTNEVLAESLYIEGPTTSTRKALCLEKMSKLKEAFYIKYKIIESKKQDADIFIIEATKRKCRDLTKIMRAKAAVEEAKAAAKASAVELAAAKSLAFERLPESSNFARVKGVSMKEATSKSSVRPTLVMDSDDDIEYEERN